MPFSPERSEQVAFGRWSCRPSGPTEAKFDHTEQDSSWITILSISSIKQSRPPRNGSSISGCV